MTPRTRPSDAHTIAAVLESCATSLRAYGPAALQHTWAARPGEHGGGGYSRRASTVPDPTGAAATGLAESDWSTLARLLRTLWAAAVEVQSLVHLHGEPATITNERAGIGRCADCSRFCDGSRDHRVTRWRDSDDLVCTACRKRRDRRPMSTTKPAGQPHDVNQPATVDGKLGAECVR